MSTPAFAASSVPGLYWLAEPALPPAYGVALLPAETPSPAPPSITLAESWTAHPGLYLMTATKPATADEAAFAAAARAVWAWLGASARFAWVADSTLDPSAWAPKAIEVVQDGGAATATLVAPARLAFGRYAVALYTGSVLTLAADGFALSGGGAAFATDTRSWPLTATGTSLSFGGAVAGCLLLGLMLQPGDDTAEDPYATLDVGLRLAVDDERPDFAEAGLLHSLRYPVFTGVPAGGVAFDGTFDPALPADAARSRLAFAAPVAHGSLFRSPLGHAAQVTPRTGGSGLPAGLAFHRQPPSHHAVPGDDPLYLAPIGAFGLTLATGDPRLACGLSGYEYFAMSGTDAAIITFTPGCAAYAGGLVPREASDGDRTPIAMTTLATCPYATVSSTATGSVLYHAQPRRGALHSADGAGGPYLRYFPVPVGTTTATPASAYPLLPYAGAAGSPRLRERLEAQALAPCRRDALGALAPAPPDTTPATTAVTPRGLLSRFGAGRSVWQSLQLAAAEPGEQGAGSLPPPLELHTLVPGLRNALLSEELCCVIADPAELAGTDFNYVVTDATLRGLRDLPATERPSDAVLVGLASVPPATSTVAFVTSLDTAVPGWRTWRSAILDQATYFETDIEGWRFRLSPTLWGADADPANPVIAIFKFASTSLRTLLADPGSWTWPDAARVGGTLDPTLAALREIVERADAQWSLSTPAQPSPLRFFVERVLDDPSWNGFLVLNAPVPLDTLPAELRGLSAGIDQSRFRAHHVGVSVSPVSYDTSTGALSLGRSPMFGLVDYEDEADIAHTFDDFDFKVLALRVLFADSAVADFSSRAELFVNRLFGDGVLLSGSEHYNNLVLEGSYQRAQGGGHYVFRTAHAGTFDSASEVLGSVEVSAAQFTTTGTGDTVTARFTLWGRLRFELLDGLDVFSFGPVQPSETEPVVDGWLSYAGLAVDMTFRSDAPTTTRAFSVDVGSTAFDAATSAAREDSLFWRFPLQVGGLLRGAPGTTPHDLGFLPVRAPLRQSTLANGWHALTFTVDLGTLGALAADAGLTATLVAAWGTAADGPAVNVGLKLPGIDAPGRLLPLEGILEMGFGAVDLSAAPAPSGGPSYVLRLQRFSLRLLGWQFPPGQADIALFGDPDVARAPTGGRRGALGWYASYQAKD